MRSVLLLALCLTAACACRGDDDPIDDTGLTDTSEVVDADGDGVPADEDCDDDPAGCGADCFPGNPAADTCDGYDNDCDNSTDEDEGSAWYPDCDGDGAYASAAVTSCGEPTSTTACDDGALPDGGFTETAPTDADCDDEDAAANREDLDSDGYSTCDGDCDDDPSGCGALCAPGNTTADTCDGYDLDCDGTVGEDDTRAWYPDCDGDGDFAATGVSACAEPTTSPCADGQAPDGGWRVTAPTTADCDDADAAANHDDADGDGLSACDGDCDDDPAACGADCHPSLGTDGCDSYDNDCDNSTDEDPDLAWYVDADGDGSTVGTATTACTAPSADHIAGASATADCDDTDAALNTRDDDDDGETTCAGDCDDDPDQCGAACTTANTVDGCGGDDNDCDNSIDEDPGSTIWYLDADQDSWVASGSGVGQCTSPGANYTTRLSSQFDCDDTSAADNHDDEDDDGVSTCGGDCDDDPAACGDACSPDLSVDACDGEDNDCDNSTDEDPPSWYEDGDQDGYTASAAPTSQCTSPGATWQQSPSTTADCDDTSAALNHDDEDGDGVSTCAGDCDDDPLACGASCSPNLGTDACDPNGYNNDCDTQTDEDAPTWYEDDDQDGWSANLTGVEQCDAPGQRWSQTPSSQADCDDASAALNHDDADSDTHSTCEGDCDDDTTGCGADCYPGNAAADVCDGANQDCDANTDEDPDLAWFVDSDEDGWSSSDSVLSCASPGAGYTDAATNPLDCDDNDPALNHDDADSDGETSCEGDCADDDATLDPSYSDAGLSASQVNTGASETWYDGADQDCDGANDFDQDGDGYVATAFNSEAGGTANGTGDCDDDPTDDTDNLAANVRPGATEFCNGINDDCDSNTDEASTYPAFYPDSGGLPLNITNDATISEPGAVNVCSVSGYDLTITANDVDVLGRHGFLSYGGAITYATGTTGGTVESLHIEGTLTIQNGASVTTAGGMDITGDVQVDGTWTATDVNLVRHSTLALEGQVTVGATGSLTANYWDVNNLTQGPPLVIEGTAVFTGLSATGNSRALPSEGGVIYGASGSSLTLWDSTLVGNSLASTTTGDARGTGGAIHSAGDVEIYGFSYVYDNVALTGSEVFIATGGSLTANGTSFESTAPNNVATGSPYDTIASIQSGGTVNLTGVQMRAYGTAGVAIRTGGPVTISDSTIRDCAFLGVHTSGAGSVEMTNVGFTRVPDPNYYVTSPNCADSAAVITADGTAYWWGETATVTGTCDTACSGTPANQCP